MSILNKFSGECSKELKTENSFFEATLMVCRRKYKFFDKLWAIEGLLKMGTILENFEVFVLQRQNFKLCMIKKSEIT